MSYKDSSSSSKIRQAKQRLGLDEPTYLRVITVLTGKASLKETTPLDRSKILAHYQALGFDPVPLTKSAYHRAERIQQIKKLWTELAALGVLSDSSDQGLSQFAKRHMGVEQLERADIHRLKRCIKTLEAWIERTQVHALRRAKLRGMTA